MAETFTCSNCGEEHPMDQCILMEDQELCPSCAEEETVICVRCGERIWQDSNAGSHETPLCSSCYEDHYTTCSDCGRILHSDDVYHLDEDDEEDLCYSCYSRSMKKRSIQEYSYKPDPIFYGDGTRFFGVELEIDGAGEDPCHAKEVLALANQDEEHIYCKHDGSLNDGFEIVTHPMTLEYHKAHMPWKDVLAKAISLGYQSHQANTCGLHVHVNRTAFGRTEQEQDANIARILYFVEKHWEEMLKFSRRTQRQLERWAARYGYKEQPHEILNQAKKGYGGGRYSCVNLQNMDTIEFRIFRGTLKLNTLLATLQMVNYLCDVAISFSDEEIKGLSWTSFASGVHPGSSPELVLYMKERRLYVNEEIGTEAEI